MDSTPEEYLRCLIRFLPLWPPERMLALALVEADLATAVAEFRGFSHAVAKSRM
jgi:hypothetical protein